MNLYRGAIGNYLCLRQPGAEARQPTALGNRPPTRAPKRLAHTPVRGWIARAKFAKFHAGLVLTRRRQRGHEDHKDPCGAECIDLSAQGFANAAPVSEVEGDAVKLTFTDGGTPTAYYTSGSAVRLYNGGTMTVTCDFTMSKIVFDYVLDGIATVSVSPAIFYCDTKTWEGTSNSVVLTAETAKHVRIKSVTVTYESGSTSDEGGTYELVTSSTTLAAGDKCVVLDFEGGYAVGTIGGDAAAAISSGFTLTGTTVTIPSTTTDIAVFTLEASQTEGAFYLKSSLNKGKYLQLTASSINVATSTTGVDLYISTDADNNFTKIACSQETNRSLSYYPNNYFKNYATPLASG